MKITIDDKVIAKYKISREQFFFMMSLAYKITNPEIDSLLKEKFFITQNYNNGIPSQNYLLSQSGVDILNKILTESDIVSPDQKVRFEELAKQLQSLFPSGRKPGTNNYWRGNVPEIRDRLQLFIKRFGDFPDDVIIEATKEYIKTFGIDTKLMKTLKYFISKKRDDGSVEYDLLTFIENKNSEQGNQLETTKLI